MSRPSPWLIALAALFVVPVLGWQVVVYAWFQHLLPRGVDAPLVTYAKTETHGFGPGGDEVGLVVYRMSARTARRIEAGGVGYLEAAPPSPWRDGRRAYGSWRPTPVAFDDRWTRRGEHTCGHKPGMGAYVDDGGAFRCRLPARLLARLDRLIAAPGAYYAYGPGSSVVIVAPQARTVVLAYNG